jgi:hypothetical protein
MLNIKLSLLAVVGFVAVAVAPASAMPVSNLSQTAQNDVQDARLVCNSRGRCYRTGYRSGSYGGYRSYGGYAPSYGYGPSVGYGGYGYGGPGYGYGGYGYGGSGIGFSIGIGRGYF